MSESDAGGPDHYETLGVARDASTDEIKTAFRKLARECHPDVAGPDPAAAARFTRVREAYETLADPVRRATYDRRGYSTWFAGPGRHGGKWRPPGGFDFEQVGDPTPGQRAGAGGRRGRRRDPANDIGLEDIFGDFGGGDFGFGGGPKASEANRGTWAGGRPASSGPVGGGGEDPAAGARPGRDIHMKVDLPQGIADRGGTVTLRYPRLRRGDDGQSLHRYDEIHDLRVPPGVRRGDTLRVPGMGDAGGAGGPYGDLVCDLTIVPGEVADEPQHRRGQRRRPEPGAAGPRVADPAGPEAGAAPPADAHTVDITVVEALLGGRVKVQTPAGAVHVTIPPCTSSGARLRLRGRGAGGADHVVELRIVTPDRLDGESRALIERFAELNPVVPRQE
ncbi:DnaJ domain-containing protein [Myxococcota bacterium]|nr:DnaJ domain-containing protein [Myxococcota bacterium]